jgi:hypothetical protein
VSWYCWLRNAVSLTDHGLCRPQICNEILAVAKSLVKQKKADVLVRAAQKKEIAAAKMAAGVRDFSVGCMHGCAIFPMPSMTRLGAYLLAAHR